jgi:hypothetical protein
MTDKHTPGPWELIAPHQTSGWGLCVGSGEQITARIPAYAGREADARLIAAAPDLLEALKAMLEVCYDLERDDATVTAVSAARAAIASAEGQA